MRDIWMKLGTTAAAIAMASGMPSMAIAQPDTNKAFEERVRAYLLANPEILSEMVQALKAKEAAARIAPLRAMLEKPYTSAWAGAADGDVILVEFFDYACGHCRAMHPVIEELLTKDKRLKVVFRQMPILGPDSELAATASMAAAEQGRFLDYHRSIYAAAAPDAQQRAKAATAARLTGDLGPSSPRREEIDRNMEMARQLRITGTPTFIVGDQMLFGELSVAALAEAISTVRQASK